MNESTHSLNPSQLPALDQRHSPVHFSSLCFVSSRIELSPPATSVSGSAVTPTSNSPTPKRQTRPISHFRAYGAVQGSHLWKGGVDTQLDTVCHIPPHPDLPPMYQHTITTLLCSPRCPLLLFLVRVPPTYVVCRPGHPLPTNSGLDSQQGPRATELLGPAHTLHTALLHKLSSFLRFLPFLLPSSFPVLILFHLYNHLTVPYFRLYSTLQKLRSSLKGEPVRPGQHATPTATTYST